MKDSFWVIIPTYNNERTVKQVVLDVLAYTPNIIVVNDGSTDGTASLLANIPQIHLVSYPQNQGKGFALQQGFKKAIALGAQFAITIDSDGQHFASDLPAMAQKAREHPGSVIMGARNMQQEGVPGKSSFGNKFSNFWFWAETGIKLRDTQTGYRVYPLAPISTMRFFTKKFEFEIEVIVRLAWKNIRFFEVPVQVDYPENRVSHFRPTADFARISVLNTVLFISALVFFLPKLLLLNFNLKGSINQLKKEISRSLDSPLKVASAVGLGLFFGIFPIWGFQMIVAFAVATYFKLNRVLVLFFSNISIPPFLPFIIYGSYLLGQFFVAHPEHPLQVSEMTLELVHQHFVQYFIGASLLASCMAVGGFTVTFLILQINNYISKK